jgi:hypothetical protein
MGILRRTGTDHSVVTERLLPTSGYTSFWRVNVETAEELVFDNQTQRMSV